MQLVGLLIGLAGVSAVLRGFTHRTHERVTCRRCKSEVIGKKVGLGVQCANDRRHLAQIDRAAAAALVLVAAALSTFVLAIMVVGGR